ncbi:MAG TPA: Ig-like domain-containing protein, partial [Verrucomicrobiota bacterium]|nr:Ig-like domain-containing protein [Verrucomicrobiota bacterium]HNT16187.1 Ig-like domain-containing protein [Verrucomicrobiota bacterium]
MQASTTQILCANGGSSPTGPGLTAGGGWRRALPAPGAAAAPTMKRRGVVFRLALGIVTLLLGMFLPVQSQAQPTAPLQFVEAPTASGFFVAALTNTINGTGVGQGQNWSLEAETADRLTVRIETAVGNARPKLRVLNAANQTVASINGAATGIAEVYDVLLPAPGTYRVQVFSDHQASEYRLRVDLARGPQLETEPNDSIAQAVERPMEMQAGQFQLRMAGTLTSEDASGDFFRLGALAPGNSISATLLTGPYSPLSVSNTTITLYRDTSPLLATNAAFDFVVTDPGDYFVSLVASTNRDLLAQYFLTLTVTDAVPPTVAALTLPAADSVASNIINGFTVTFSEPMHAASVNQVANYSLRAAGSDGLFDTADDVLYSLLSPDYSLGTNATFAVVDGPLQPGEYRFSIAATITDRAGNPLTPALTHNFTIVEWGDFVFENRDNDEVAVATGLGV